MKEGKYMIYADNAATTKMSKKAVYAMLACIEENYGNPSSLHTMGNRARTAKENARKKIAKCLNALPNEIIFTSGGSEADNQAILTGAGYGIEKNKFHIISQKTEHHAILNALKDLEGTFDITLLDVDENGMVTAEQVKNAIRDDTAFVTIMAANNEIGTIMPIKEICEVCHERDILFHTDAVQAVGHIPIDVKEIGCDLLSFSAHKFHGAKGVGGLYVKDGIIPHTLIKGGSQENGYRAGTENVQGIVASATALEENIQNMSENTAKLVKMRNRLIEGLSEIPCSYLNGSKDNRLPSNVSMCFEGIEGEGLLLILDMKGICASSGSACNSGSIEPSYVITAIGRPKELAYSSIRFSLSEENTMEEVEEIIKATKECIEKLRQTSPVWNK